MLSDTNSFSFILFYRLTTLKEFIYRSLQLEKNFDMLFIGNSATGEECMGTNQGWAIFL